MRFALASLVILGVLTTTQCGSLGTADNPFPEDEAAQEGEEAPDGDEGSESEGSEGGEVSDPIEQYEDTGAGEEITEKHMRDLHKKFDHDKDGKVHMDEVLKFAESTRKAVAKKEILNVFDEIESTKDGHLSLEEHMKESEELHEGDDEEKAKLRAHEEAKFKAADTNGDNKLDAEELVHLMHPETHPEVLELHSKEEMRRRDTDKDGKLSQAEWEVDATHGELQDPDTHDPAADFKTLDENSDGFIDMNELRHWESGRFHTVEAMKKLYELVDKDDDKHLTVDELVKVVGRIEGHEAHAHLLDWVFHDDL